MKKFLNTVLFISIAFSTLSFADSLSVKKLKYPNFYSITVDYKKEILVGDIYIIKRVGKSRLVSLDSYNGDISFLQTGGSGSTQWSDAPRNLDNEGIPINVKDSLYDVELTADEIKRGVLLEKIVVSKGFNYKDGSKWIGGVGKYLRWDSGNQTDNAIPSVTNTPLSTDTINLQINVSFNASKRDLTNNEVASAKVNLTTSSPVDLYAYMEKNGLFYYLTKNKVVILEGNRHHFFNEKGQYAFEDGKNIEALDYGLSSVNNYDVFGLPLNANILGDYTLRVVAVSAGDYPFNANSSQLKEGLSQGQESAITFNISSANIEPKPPVEIVDSGNGGIPSPRSSRFGSAANTSISNEYFTPKLREKVLGAYSDVVNSKEEWDKLVTADKKTTLYWDYAVPNLGKHHVGERDRLWGIHPTTNQPILFDDRQKTSYDIPIALYAVGGKAARITMLEPLRSGASTAYPGCVGLSWDKMETHVRLCGEGSSKVIIGSHTYSQRWTRFNNIPFPESYVEPSAQALKRLLHYGEDEQVGRKRLKKEYGLLNMYDLNVQTVIDNILPHEVLFNFPVDFEVSISKVPGDFSSRACKPDRAIQYGGNIRVSATQIGFPTRLPLECQFDSNRLQHYYINTRAVNIDTVNKEINESTCGAGSGCKVELYNFLDGS